MLASAAAVVAGVAAAPSAEPWPRWEPSDPTSKTVVDHTPWDGFLANYVVPADGGDSINLVAYGRVTDDDRSTLEMYVDGLAGMAVAKLRRDEQRAYWINLYNALTVRLILDNYPLDSIRDVSDSLFSSGPWDDEVVKVDGQALTLNDIEHRILRPIWRDARVHYAVNCASFGCPNLAGEAFTAANAEEMLDAGAKAYVNHPRGATITNGELMVSSIYKWYAVDFGDSDAGVIDHLKQYAAAKLRGQLDGITAIAGDDYNWSLNEAR